jgi:hypothetical protein
MELEARETLRSDVSLWTTGVQGKAVAGDAGIAAA